VDPLILAAIIEGVSTLAAALIAALVAHYLWRRWLRQQKLQRELDLARRDILFLLEVERQYIELARANHLPGALTVRRQAKEQNVDWSGKNTYARIKRYLHLGDSENRYS
jgi:hypothetical protein